MVTQAAAAQTWKVDPDAKRLAWGTANVVLRSDTASGVQIWAATSRVRDGSIPTRNFAARFDPDSVVVWLAYARELVNATTTPVDSKARLMTPALRATDGSVIVLERKQKKKKKWASQISVIFAAREAQSTWSILAEKDATQDFLRSLFQTASRSFYQPGVLALLEPNPADSASCPRPLSMPSLLYPPALQAAGTSGDVWLTFVVKADSTVDPASVQVLVSDSPEFTASAVKAITSVRYLPVTRQGANVDALAFQRVSFLLR
jgi:TonB family protein